MNWVFLKELYTVKSNNSTYNKSQYLNSKSQISIFGKIWNLEFQNTWNLINKHYEKNIFSFCIFKPFYVEWLFGLQFYWNWKN